ncbi:MAG TPA: hypothetical protein VK668_20900 [Mucilaginibacter sp.]|nr:hypothetical protein [Mucilaginibacter sp.]
MRQLVDFKSDFNNPKLIKIWLAILCVLIFPWLVVFFRFNKVITVFAIFINMAVVFAVIAYIKISLKIIIYPQEHIIEYYWMRLFAKKSQITIDIKNAHLNLDIINYKGNNLWNLIITDNNDPGKKISLTEITDGFDGQQIKTMYQVLKQVSTD